MSNINHIFILFISVSFANLALSSPTIKRFFCHSLDHIEGGAVDPTDYTVTITNILETGIDFNVSYCDRTLSLEDKKMYHIEYATKSPKGSNIKKYYHDNKGDPSMIKETDRCYKIDNISPIKLGSNDILKVISLIKSYINENGHAKFIGLHPKI